MADNVQRSRGRGKGYKFDRGGNPTEFGPFIGEVTNNVDVTRSGRLQVYIEQFGGDNPQDKSLWRTVSYVPPFYGAVNQTGTNQGVGTYVGNPQSYGMWFTPPDIGTQVICFFVAGDPNQGYYIGCVPDPGISHMVPAVGASTKFELGNDKQKEYYKNAKQLPVTEINADNSAIEENPKYFDQKKPVHGYVAGVMLQQGVIDDTARGPITSNSQRESPSSTYGISTPGRPVYAAGLTDEDVKQKVSAGNGQGAKLTDVKVTARRGGHSLVMDDGNLEGKDNLVRIRTSNGHQITMSDDGNFFYIIHANGQTWVELGSEGTIDLFSTNSVNIRTQGEINLHADKAINMYSDDSINFKSKSIKINAVESFELASKTNLTIYSESDIGIGADGILNLKSKSGAWNGGDSLALKGQTINLNGPGGAGSFTKPALLKDLELPDVAWVDGTGWKVEPKKLKTIATRAPTHEPYPYHNKGVEVKSSVTEFTGEKGAEGGTSGSGAGFGGFSGIPSIPAIVPPAISGSIATAVGSAGTALNNTTTALSASIATASTAVGSAVSQVSTAVSGAVAGVTGAVSGVVAGVTGAVGGVVSQVGAAIAPVTAAASGLINQVVTLPVNAGLLLKQIPAIRSIGNLNPAQVTGMLASTALAVGQTASQISNGKGVGVFGFSPVQLEQVGLIKPGTIAKFGAAAPNLTSFLASPTIWTGKNGVSNLSGLLNNPNLQNRLQQDLMQQGLTQLRKSGIVKGLESVPQLAGLVNSAVQFGPAAITNWAKGQANAAIVNQISKVFKNSEFASILSNAVNIFVGISGQRPVNIAGIIDTVNRVPVNAAVVGVIGNAKVQPPNYRTISVDIRKGQQEVRTAAFNQAMSEGKTEREAAAIGAAAGNEYGAAELAKVELGSGATTGAAGTTGNAPIPASRNPLQEFRRDFGTQTAQAPGQSTFLGTGSTLPGTRTGVDADAALAQTRGVNVNPNDSQFQSQAQIDAEIAQEAKLAANRNVLGRLTR
jgi:hypothetical protein